MQIQANKINNTSGCIITVCLSCGTFIACRLITHLLHQSNFNANNYVKVFASSGSSKKLIFKNSLFQLISNNFRSKSTPILNSLYRVASIHAHEIVRLAGPAESILKYCKQQLFGLNNFYQQLSKQSSPPMANNLATSLNNIANTRVVDALKSTMIGLC